MISPSIFRGRRALTTPLCAALLLFTSNVFAASGDFERGLKLYESGAFEKAIDAFDGAVTSAPNSADSHFYLGLSRYKLNRYAAAGVAFERAAAINPKYGAALLFRGLSHQADGAYKKAVPFFEKAAAADSEFAQLATYNIGISWFRAGDREAAKAALTQAIALDTKSDTAEDARKFLATVEAAGGEGARKWSASMSAGYQYDDNVTTDEIDENSNVHDTAFVLDGSASYRLLQGGAVDLEIGYDFFQSLYDDQDAFDLQVHGLSLTAGKEIAGFDAALTYIYSRVWLGRNDFLGLHNITPSLGYGITPEWYASVAVNVQDKNFLENKDRNSRVHSVGLTNFIFFMDGKANFSIAYRIEDEDTSSSEFDYLGHFLNAAVKAPIPGAAIAKWHPAATLGWAYYNKNYNSLTASIDD